MRDRCQASSETKAPRWDATRISRGSGSFSPLTRTIRASVFSPRRLQNSWILPWERKPGRIEGHVPGAIAWRKFHEFRAVGTVWERRAPNDTGTDCESWKKTGTVTQTRFRGTGPQTYREIRRWNCTWDCRGKTSRKFPIYLSITAISNPVRRTAVPVVRDWNPPRPQRGMDVI